MVQTKQTAKIIVNEDLAKLNGKSRVFILKDKIFSAYCMDEKFICIDTHKVINDTVQLE